MKNFQNNKSEQVEVMALFGYEMTPCQPLSFKRRGDNAEVEVTEQLGAQMKFIKGVAHHFFDVLAGKDRYRLEFNSHSLVWTLA